MSEEKLTVAELLARAQKEHPSDPAAAPRRRRRRSLEEGGISVQDLTGSIPRVKAEGPRRGAHALRTEAEDIDEQIAQQESAAEVSDDVQVVSDPELIDAVSNEPPVEEDQAEVSKPEDIDAQADESEDAVQVEEYADEAAPVEESVADEETAPAAEPVPSEEPRVAEETAAWVAPEQPVAKPVLPVAVPLAPRPVMVNEERREITYTFTELRDMETQTKVVAEPGPVARDVLTGSLSYDDRPTASLPVIAEEENAPAPEAPIEAPTAAATAVDSAPVEPVAESCPEPELAPEPQPEPEREPETADVEETTVMGLVDVQDTEHEESAELEDTFVEEPVVAEPEAEQPQVREAAAVEDDADYREDNSLSVVLLIIQVFVGLMLGILVFICFAIAWTRLPFVVTAIMAIVVTGGFTLIANYVRRKRDVATPILAAIVGLAITFGPWLMVNL